MAFLNTKLTLNVLQIVTVYPVAFYTTTVFILILCKTQDPSSERIVIVGNLV